MKTPQAVLFLLMLAAFAPIAAFGQYLPPSGTGSFNNYLSPTLLSGGGSVTSQESPQSDSINPAAAGAKQRVTLDASYLGLVGTQTGEGWQGHIANLGITIPTKVGVFSGSGHFMSSALSEVDLGTVGELNASFAKQIYPDLLVGAGLHFLLGTNVGTDWGLSGDLGFLAFPGQTGFMKNFRWGIVMQGLGKGFAPVPGVSGYPPAFTPVVGAAFDVVDNSTFRIGFSGDLGFPEFQDVSVNLGTKITFRNNLSLSVSEGADLQSLLNPGSRPNRSYIPAVGLTYSFSTNLGSSSRFLQEHGWNRTTLNTEVSAAPMPGGAWAFGTGINAPLGVVDRTPPTIVVDYPKPAWISPNNDGVQDYIQFPIRITDDRYVAGYRLDIYNDKGDLVRQIQNALKPPATRDFRTAVDQLLSVKSGIPVPPTLRWGGLDNNGKVVPDGTYTFKIQAWDDNGNMATSPTYTVHVKNTPPEVSVKQLTGDQLIFAPNSTSTKNSLAITQSGSVENLWKGEITNADGTVVRTLEWKDSAPKSFVWDGKANDGSYVPNGVYNYRLSATDLAGNRGSGSLDNIIVDTQATPVSLGIEYSYFSPNGDGVKDLDTLKLNVPVQTGIKSWSLVITNSSGREVRSFSGTGSVPAKLVFDGRSNDGAPLPEGAYVAHLAIDYVNGNQPTADSAPMTIQLTPPKASITENYTIFSPVGNGDKNTITFYQDTTTAELWKGEIKNAKGDVVKSYSWRGTADTKVVWDGHGDNGLLVPDGTYSYRLVGNDRAGNVGRSNTLSFEINTQNTPVFLSAEYPAFSPNGPRNSMGLYPQVRGQEGIHSYQLDIVTADGKVVRTFSGTGKLPPSFQWEGLTNHGTPANDGTYQGILHVVYQNGNKRSAPSPSFILDTKFPSVSATANWTLFDPTSGSARPTITITNRTSNEPLWEADILDSSGSIVRQDFWKGTAGPFVWDGKDMQGNMVPDGTYSYQISATNIAGNTTRAVIRNIVVDTRPTPVFVTASAPGFSPNGDGIDDTITFSTVENQQSGVDRWELKILDAEGKAVRSFSGGSQLPTSITWDGKNESGSVSADGLYTAEYQVFYAKGAEPISKTTPVILDARGPQVHVSVGPLPFAPDNTGSSNELHIKTQVSDLAPIKAWSIDIFDPKDHPFKTLSGTGAPSSDITWDGKANDGELVSSAEDYTYRMTVTDEFGNRTVVGGTIPIDVLVIQEGNQLRIRIPSIIFAPDSAALDTSSSEIQAKNAQILNRLAEILKKYYMYNIRIEGFAVSVYWYDPVKARQEQQDVLIPLSKARAETVKKALVERGIDPARMTTVGLGSENPVVPNSDLQNRWKNRRVEFILIK